MKIDQIRQNPRVTVRTEGPPDAEGNCIVYWMQRSQRALDNPALNVAIEIGNELKKPVVVFFAPTPFYPHANIRHYQFLADGIPGMQEGLAKLHVGFVLRAYPDHKLAKFCGEVKPAIVIGDENPMRGPEQWRVRASEQLRVPLWTVDSDVVVPSKLLGKEHYAARTIRPRLHEQLPRFLVKSAQVKARTPWKRPKGLQSLGTDEDFISGWDIDRSVAPVSNWKGGTTQALRVLKEFLRSGLKNYVKDRNHPELKGTSQLSPYLHFGHIGPLTIALAVRESTAPKAARDAFLEQLIVRRELSVNFVRYNSHYDHFESLEPWANRSLSAHAADVRRVVYSEKQMEEAETEDPLWNAAQKQMLVGGWMHNYMRMYWAKKILEWSPSVAVAYQRAVLMNDRYEIDGRDPNGYAGIAWAIVGKHDRPWFERPIFGQIRYMSYASTSKKFDSKRYIEEVNDLEKGSRD